MDDNITLLQGCEKAVVETNQWEPTLSILGQSMWVASGFLSTYHASWAFWREKTPFNLGVLASSAGSMLYSGSLLVEALADVEHDHKHYLLPLTTTGCTIAVICHQYYQNKESAPSGHIKAK